MCWQFVLLKNKVLHYHAVKLSLQIMLENDFFLRSIYKRK